AALQRRAVLAGEQRRGRASAEPGDLPVAEPAAISPALQRVAAAHHPGVDPGHGERAGPHPQTAVVPGPARIALVAQAGLGSTVRAQRIRIGDYLAELRAGPHL